MPIDVGRPGEKLHPAREQGEIIACCSVRNYPILLSIRQTCKYSSLDFFDFLRSGEKDIHAFQKSRRGRCSLASEPKALPATRELLTSSCVRQVVQIGDRVIG